MVWCGVKFFLIYFLKQILTQNQMTPKWLLLTILGAGFGPLRVSYFLESKIRTKF